MNAIAFCAIVLTSWDKAVRYFYPLVYLLALWIALTLLTDETFVSRRRLVATGLVIVSAVYFIVANYYNFVYQFACQYYTRAEEHDVLQTVDQLLRDGQTVNITFESEYEDNIVYYFNAYLPFYKQTNYRITVAAITVPYYTGYGVDPNANIQKPGSYYISQHDALPTGHHPWHCFDHRHVSKLLWWCDRLSSAFQFGHPAFYWVDTGAPNIGRHGENTPLWHLSVCHATQNPPK